MNRLLSILLFAATLTGAYGQNASSEKASIEVLLSNEGTIDSLVDLAISNSYYLNGYKAELSQQHEVVKQEKNKWLSTFRMGVNFFSLNTSVNSIDQSVTRLGVLPNLGLTLTIDPEKFVNRGSYIRKANLGVTRAESQLNYQRKMLRTEILDLYYRYLEALGIIELREVATQSHAEQCKLLEEKFKKGDGRLEDLLNNQAALVISREALLKAQLAARKARQEIAILISDSEKYFQQHPKM